MYIINSLLVVLFSLVTFSNTQAVASPAVKMEKVKARYSFKKGQKNQKVLDRLAGK